MKTKLLLTMLFFFGCFAVNAQIVSGTITNKNTLKPIDKVAIITDLKRGSTSNKNGNYSIQITNIKSVTFSSLGYETLTLSLETLKKQNFNVSLVEKVNELDEIQLNLSKISLDSLLIKTQRSMQKTYISGATKNDFYAREKTKLDFKKLALDLEKSTLLNRKNKKLAEEDLEVYAKKLQTSNPEFSSEFRGSLLSKKIYSDSLKRKFIIRRIDSIEGITFMKNDENITLKSAQNKLQNIVLKHLDTSKTYKISSGLFKVEDSLSIKELIEETDSLDQNNTFGVHNATYFYNDLQRNGLFFNKNKQHNFLNSKYYEHQLVANKLLGNKLYYSINFLPNKSKSKFSGTILIDPKDFTIAKIEYNYAEGKRGQNFNLKWLMGIKVAQNVKNVAIYYEKNENNKLYIAYAKETLENYAYVHRPIKFKENTKEKHKAKFDIKIELNTRETKEIFVLNSISIDDSLIKPLQKEDWKKRKSYLSNHQYKNTNWKNRQLVIDYLEKHK